MGSSFKITYFRKLLKGQYKCSCHNLAAGFHKLCVFDHLCSLLNGKQSYCLLKAL